MSWQAKRFRNTRHEPTSKHHRKPTSLGGGNGRNISELPRSLHESWHTLFRDWSPERIAEEINARYLDPDWEMVAVKKRGFKKGECE